MNKKKKKKRSVFQKKKKRIKVASDGVARGAFGNKQSRDCKHIFETERWKFTNCVKCGAKDNLVKKSKSRSKLKVIRLF